ncbi:MAG: metal ABC transporter solute-binding protein, Zn/Mn family [Rhodospirillaceae bacterium]
MTSRRLLLTSATALVALSMTAPTVAWADEDHTHVVATFSILGDMVERIGGDHIELTTLVGANGDSHVYQPTPQDARAVQEADVLIVNGLEFEGWLERLSEAAGFKGTLVVATNGIDAIPFEGHEEHHGHGEEDHGHEEHAHDDHHDHDHDKHGHEEHAHDDHHDHDHDKHGHEEHAHDDHHDHDHDKHGHEEHAHDDHHDHDHDKHGHDDHAHDDHAHDDHHDHDHDKHGHEEHAHDDHAGHGHEGHDHGAYDPHAWQTLENAVIYVDNISAALAKADPDHAGVFAANREAYVAEIKALETEVDALMAGIPEDSRTIVTSHDAFGYLGQHYGLTFKAPQGMSTESEASAGDVAALITQIKEQNIKAVFVESITDNRLLEQIANETGATIGGTLYSGALSEKDGPAPTYLDMIRHNALTISQALGS